MHRIAILGSPQSWHGQELEAALKKRGLVPSFVDPTRLTARLGTSGSVDSCQLNLSEIDLLLVREVPGGSLEQVIYRMDALHQLENGGVCVANSPYAIEKMVDKYYSLSLLHAAGIRVPETIVTEGYVDAMEGFHRLGEEVVVKPLFGSRGIGMVRVTDQETAGRVFKALQLGGYVYYLQKFIPHLDRDIRVLMVGEECTAGMERVSENWKTNIAAGGRPVPIELSDEIQEISRRAAHTLGAVYCGVDLMRSETGELYVLEVNSMPAWQGLQQVTRVNLAESIVDFCLSNIS